MVSSYFIAVQGTNSWTDVPLRRMAGVDRLWWKPGSRFSLFLERQGLGHARPDRPFQWDTELGGMFWQKDERGWQAAGSSLLYYAEQLPLWKRNIIAHSHGGQVVLFACAQGLQVRNVIFIGVPVRKELQEAATLAATRIQYWHSVADPDDDTQTKGGLFDGRVGVARFYPQCQNRDIVPGIGHSSVLYDESRFPIWTQNQWTTMLKRGY